MAPAKKTGPLLKSFEDALASNTHTEAIDDAVIQAGRSIAQAIDDILADPAATPTEKTKALYLTPHLVSILRELLATPLARKSLGLAAAEQKKAGRLTLIKDAAKKSTS